MPDGYSLNRIRGCVRIRSLRNCGIAFLVLLRVGMDAIYIIAVLRPLKAVQTRCFQYVNYRMWIANYAEILATPFSSSKCLLMHAGHSCW